MYDKRTENQEVFHYMDNARESGFSPHKKPETGPATALDGLRVLELSQGFGQYAGKLLAQLGATVILVEPPGGCSTRREAPFVDDRPSLEGSLSYAYFNQGKKGICVDLDAAEGQEIFKKLAESADLVISSERPGVMHERDLDGDQLRLAHPQLISANISLFGETGPLSHYNGDDLVALALGGLLFLGGYPGQAPVAPWGQQAILAAAQFAAVACLVALWDVEQNGAQGQHLDISVQESVAMALENSAQFFDLEKKIRKRNGGEQRQAGTGVFPCEDGMIYLMAGGIASNRFWRATVDWLVDEKLPGAAALGESRWNDQEYLLTDEAKDIFASIFLPYAARSTKAVLYAEGQRRRIPVCPVNTPADLLKNRQLVHRDFFQSVPHLQSGRTLTMPGAPYRLEETPWLGGNPAPSLGQDTFDVLSEIGIDAGDQAALFYRGIIS